MANTNKNSTKEPSVLFVAEEREPLFSKKNRALLTDPIPEPNP